MGWSMYCIKKFIRILGTLFIRIYWNLEIKHCDVEKRKNFNTKEHQLNFVTKEEINKPKLRSQFRMLLLEKHLHKKGAKSSTAKTNSHKKAKMKRLP